MIFNTVQFGGGARIDVKAVGDATSAVVGDKVILIPTEDLFWDDTIYGGNYDTGNTASAQGWIIQSYLGGLLSSSKFEAYPAFKGSTSSSNLVRAAYFYNNLDESNPALVTSTHVSSLTSSSSTTTRTFTLVDYRDSFHFAVYGTYGGYNQPYYNPQTVGRVLDNVYSPIGNTPSIILGNSSGFPAAFSYVDGHISYTYNYGEISDTGVTWYLLGALSGNYRNAAIPVKYNGTWYVIMSGSQFSDSGSYVVGEYFPWGTTSSSYSYPSGGTYVYCDNSSLMTFSCYLNNVVYIDDDTEYFWIGSGTYNSTTWALWRLVKSPTTWKFEALPEATAMLHEVVSNNNTISFSYNIEDWFNLCCKDRGDYVEIITAPQYKNLSENPTVIGHFILDKASGNMTRLPDVLKWSEVESSLQRVCGLQVNWEIGLVAICLCNQTASSQGAIKYYSYVRKLDSVPKIYKYYGYPNTKANYYTDAITGFVRANKGVNEIGDTVLTVETIEDPDISWDNRGILYGMEITINGSF